MSSSQLSHCLAKGRRIGDQRHPMGQVAREGLYFYGTNVFLIALSGSTTTQENAHITIKSEHKTETYGL